MTRDQEIKGLIDLVKFDYERSLAFIDGVVRVSIGIRTIAMASCLALLAAAMQTDQAFLALFAFLAAAAFGAQDAYHGWLYAEARKRAKRMESLIDAYYKQIQGGASRSGEVQLLKRLRKHSIGLRLSLTGPVPPNSRRLQAEWRGETTQLVRLASRLKIGWLASASATLIAQARPRIVYLLLYPLLIGLSAIVALVLLFGSSSNSDDRTMRVCVGCGTRADIQLLPPPGRDTAEAQP